MAISELGRGALYELLVRLCQAYQAPAVDFEEVRAVLQEYEG